MYYSNCLFIFLLFNKITYSHLKREVISLDKTEKQVSTLKFYSGEYLVVGVIDSRSIFSFTSPGYGLDNLIFDPDIGSQK